MDIYSYLIADHRKVAKLMDDLLEINLQAVQQRLFEEIRTELILHAGAEEVVFYKALAEAAARDETMDRDLRHAWHEHSDIRALLDQLTQTSVASPRWMEIFGELKHAVESHVAEEETEVFAEARHLIDSDRADTMGDEMDDAKVMIRAQLSIPEVAQ